MYKSQYHATPVEAAFNKCCSWENLFTGQDHLWIPCMMWTTRCPYLPLLKAKGQHLRSQCFASLRLCEKWSLKMLRVVTRACDATHQHEGHANDLNLRGGTHHDAGATGRLFSDSCSLIHCSEPSHFMFREAIRPFQISLNELLKTVCSLVHQELLKPSTNIQESRILLRWNLSNTCQKPSLRSLLKTNE